MTLINRVSRLFRADLHAVLDRVEEPDLLLHQAVREMEDDLAADRRRLAGLAAQGRMPCVNVTLAQFQRGNALLAGGAPARNLLPSLVRRFARCSGADRAALRHFYSLVPPAVPAPSPTMSPDLVYTSSLERFTRSSRSSDHW